MLLATELNWAGESKVIETPKQFERQYTLCVFAMVPDLTVAPVATILLELEVCTPVK